MEFCRNVLVLAQRKRKQFWTDDIQLEFNVLARIYNGTRVRVDVHQLEVKDNLLKLTPPPVSTGGGYSIVELKS